MLLKPKTESSTTVNYVKRKNDTKTLKKRKLPKKVYGSLSNYKFNVRTRFFTKLLYKQVGVTNTLSNIRTFLTDTPVLFFQRSWPSKQSLFRLLFARFAVSVTTFAHLPTFNSTNVFNYRIVVKSLYDFTRSYLLFFFKSATEHFYFSRNFSRKVKPVTYFLNLKFQRNGFFVNIYSNLKKNYLSLTLGLFLSFLKKKKAFKKNVLLKLLAMRFLRKMFMALTFTNLQLRVRGIPADLPKLLNTLHKPIIHLFMDPLSERMVDEKSPEYQKHLAENPPILTPYIHFIKSKSYTFMKTRKRGRIKRKIRRKLVKINNTAD